MYAIIGSIGAAATRRSGRSDGSRRASAEQPRRAGAADTRAERIVDELRLVGQERPERARRRHELRRPARFPVISPRR